MSDAIPWQEPWPGAVPRLEIDVESVGLIVVDVQGPPPSGERGEVRDRRARARDMLIPNIQLLLAWFRAHGRPVVFLRVGSFLPDAEDQYPHRRLAWGRWAPDAPTYRRPVGSAEHGIRPEIAPLPEELVIDKNSTGAFNSSSIEFYLHQLGLRTLVVTGLQTYACVNGTVRDAADRGYNVILVADACSPTADEHAAAAAALRTFARYFGAVKTTAEVLAELDSLARAPALAGHGGAR
jgi:nicotinamidase-related amidase